MKNRFLFLLPAIAWSIICTILLTLPASAFPADRWYTKIPMFDKWVHIGLFTILAFLFCWGILKKASAVPFQKQFIQTGLLCLLYGIAMEFVQRYFVANRSFDIGDIIADGAGAFAGVYFSIWRFIKNKPL